MIGLMTFPIPGPESYGAELPNPDLRVDFGVPSPGSSNPMPEERRAWYEQRIRDSVEAQRAGAARASERSSCAELSPKRCSLACLLRSRGC